MVCSIRWRQRFFSFWLELTRFKGVRRQRRQLANGLGKYAKIARIFARMKLYAFEERRFLIFICVVDFAHADMYVCMVFDIFTTIYMHVCVHIK